MEFYRNGTAHAEGVQVMHQAIMSALKSSSRLAPSVLSEAYARSVPERCVVGRVLQEANVPYV